MGANQRANAVVDSAIRDARILAEDIRHDGERILRRVLQVQERIDAFLALDYPQSAGLDRGGELGRLGQTFDQQIAVLCERMDQLAALRALANLVPEDES